MAISDEQRLYGQLIVDFANAASTDDAGLRYFENVQKAFGFSHQFADHAKAAFPVLAGFIDTFTEGEKKCCGLISEIKMIESDICSVIIAASVKYDVHSNIFHVEDWTYGHAEAASRDLTIEQMKKILRTNCSQPDSKEYNEKVLSHSLPKLLALSEQISALEGMSRERYGQISERESAYDDVQKEHRQIVGIQDDLKSLLLEIVKSERKGDSEVNSGRLSRYNDRNTFSDPPIKTEPLDKKLFNETYFLDRHDSFDALYKIYNPPIDYCVNEFLGVVGNLEYLKQCERCGKFYIANRLIERQKRCSICSKKTRKTRKEMADYMKEYRRQNKSMKEAKIKKHMEKGLSRKQAVELLKNA